MINDYIIKILSGHTAHENFCKTGIKTLRSAQNTSKDKAFPVTVLCGRPVKRGDTVSKSKKAKNDASKNNGGAPTADSTKSADSMRNTTGR